MNPVLIKPSGDRQQPGAGAGQAVRGRDRALLPGPQGRAAARRCSRRSTTCARRFDVVVCEGAGSPAEINLRANDLANMGLARAADLPGRCSSATSTAAASSPSLYGTLALLEPEDQALIAGFLINKFRGDPSILAPGLDMLRKPHRPPHARRPAVARRAVHRRRGLARAAQRPQPTARHARRRRHPPALDEQLHRRRRARGRARRVGALSRARRPTSSAPTSSSCPARRPPSRTSSGLRDDGPRPRAAASARGPILGICGGYQMLGTDDRGRRRERRRAASTASACCRSAPRFAPEKLLRQRRAARLGRRGDRLRDPPRPRRHATSR